MNTKTIKVEICCGSIADCKTAQLCGADRIELVSAHQLGGLTPSYATLLHAKEAVSLPIAVIIRPRMSGFFYSEEDFCVMCDDAKQLSQLGADGIVFGFLKEDGTLDYERCAKFLDFVQPKESVFHRAFDLIPNPEVAIEQLISLGVTRVLTSGGMPDCITGKEQIRFLQQTYGKQIQILPGGGITESNITSLVLETGVTQVHFGGTSLQTDPSCTNQKTIAFGSLQMPPNECYIAVDQNRVQQMIAQLQTI